MPKMIYKILFWSGFYGVCIFFVISGFLITTSALNKWGSLPNLKPGGFYSMRFSRIIPLLVSLLLVLSLLHLAGINGFVINPAQASLGRSIFAALTFHINMLEIKVGYLPGSWDILWSLSIEEVFYLFFPLLCFVLRKEWHFGAIISVFLIISPFARTVWFPGNDLSDRNYFAYMDAIALGCISAIFTKRIEISKTSLIVISIVGWGLFLMVMIFRTFVHNLGLTEIGLNVSLLAFGTALILIWMQKRLLNGQQKPSRFTGFLRFLGRNSYEVYLTHMFVVFILVKEYNVLKLRGEWAWVLYFLAILISGILGELVARYFSNPANNYLRERLKRFY
jgi:peptidoglycan/LPS O-acetylase OafA/YrhL